MSGSMYGKIGHTLKIDRAKEAVQKQLNELDSNTKIGLVVMGGKKRKGCRNYRVAVPVAMHTKRQISEYIEHIRPRGRTPLARALKKAVESLAHPDRASIVLISDGKESCGDQACRVAKELKEHYPQIEMKIISLATDNAAKKKLQCIMDVMGGHADMVLTTTEQKRRAPKADRAREEISKGTVSPEIKLFAAFPLEDQKAEAEHRVYSEKGTLILHCVSTEKKECIRSISPGRYIVHTTYQKREHITKLLVLDGMDAFLYTSFRKKSMAEEGTYTSDETMVESAPIQEEIEKENRDREMFMDTMIHERMKENNIF